MSEPVTKRTDADARRQQIVDAASACARRSGFHGASMAEIAQTAGLSVGQIYRYFENKEAIIAAIVARNTAEMRDIFTEMQDAGEPLLDKILAKCVSAVDDAYDRDRAALMLEVAAEAARNPAVAAIVESADAEERRMKLALIERVLPPGCDPAEGLARSEVTSMLFDGMTVRGVNNPGADRQAIARVLRTAIRCVLTAPLDDPKT
ncbi:MULTISPECIES: TetR/AcrR family transcriptional regulator [unclassified Phenylobacterium]|uniref:TetR/AcrR family transcriptional regulator n=1 Tax=unclassified Phenylobacterium TaxID=2640670 RepID=UPI00083ACABB|nr:MULTISPECIES: TetR/AcrR family transcriptional regulator [unclassified Phenylobacterium]